MAEITPKNTKRKSDDKKPLAPPQAPKKAKVVALDSSDNSVEHEPKDVKGPNKKEKNEKDEELITTLKAKLKKKEKELGSKEAELAGLKEELESKETELGVTKAENVVYLANIAKLEKRKEKEGTLQIVKNLEIKTSKFKEKQTRLKLKNDSLTEKIAELETSLAEKDEEVKKAN